MWRPVPFNGPISCRERMRGIYRSQGVAAGYGACVVQLVAELFPEGDVPESLSADKRIGEIIQLRNELSHGNVPITGEVIDQASGHLQALEQAAYEVLERFKRTRVSCGPLA